MFLFNHVWTIENSIVGFIDKLISIKIKSFLVVDVLHMTTKVAALSESFFAPRALEWPLSCVLSEMVTEVATFLEYAITTLKFAFEV